MATLLGRMRDGDRAAVGEFMLRYASRIRRRIQGKLNPLVRRVFDSDDILSTLGRRLDLFVRNGKVKALSEAQFWTLMGQMANHAVIDKARHWRRLQNLEGEDSDLARLALDRVRMEQRAAPDRTPLAIDEAMRALADETDRSILSMWLDGMSLAEISENLGLNAATGRKRWQGIRERLLDFFNGRSSK